MGRIKLGNNWWIEPYKYGWEIYREQSPQGGYKSNTDAYYYESLERALRWVYEDRLRRHIIDKDDPTLDDLYDGITKAMAFSMKLLHELTRLERK